MATDDLYAPLGLKEERSRSPLSTLLVMATLLGIALTSFVIWANTGYGGIASKPVRAANTHPSATDVRHAAEPRRPDSSAQRPEITGTIDPAEEVARLMALKRAMEEADEAAKRDEQIITIIDGRTGARREVKIPRR